MPAQAARLSSRFLSARDCYRVELPLFNDCFFRFCFAVYPRYCSSLSRIFAETGKSVFATSPLPQASYADILDAS
jgi:hypothetical protein